MEFVDRTAENPNRYKITYEDSGSSSYAKIELADNPIEAGTPLNRNTFQKMQKELNAYVEGNVLITSTNRNPTEYLGGTWELIDKGFRNNSSSVIFDKYVGDGNYYGAENYKSSYSIHCFDKMQVNCFRSQSTVRLRIEFYLKKGESFDDAGVNTAALLDFSDFGFTNLPVSYNYIPCYTDRLNGEGLLMNILGDGTVRIDDILVDDRKSNPKLVVPSDHHEAINIDITTPIRIEHMMDDYCDKFYWKRIK